MSNIVDMQIALESAIFQLLNEDQDVKAAAPGGVWPGSVPEERAGQTAIAIMTPVFSPDFSFGGLNYVKFGLRIKAVSYKPNARADCLSVLSMCYTKLESFDGGQLVNVMNIDLHKGHEPFVYYLDGKTMVDAMHDYEVMITP